MNMYVSEFEIYRTLKVEHKESITYPWLSKLDITMMEMCTVVNKLPDYHNQLIFSPLDPLKKLS